jgi:hypothetical protein
MFINPAIFEIDREVLDVRQPSLEKWSLELLLCETVNVRAGPNLWYGRIYSHVEAGYDATASATEFERPVQIGLGAGIGFRD